MDITVGTTSKVEDQNEDRMTPSNSYQYRCRTLLETLNGMWDQQFRQDMSDHSMVNDGKI